jgi:hypothetical protein
MRTRLIIIISWMVAALLATSTALAASALPTRTTSQAGVTVKATPRALEGSVWEFDVVFDTHSQELKDDLEKTAVLSVAGGETLTPLKWQGDPPGGHHRKVVVQFKPVSPRPASIELRITRPGESKPRVFQWALK